MIFKSNKRRLNPACRWRLTDCYPRVTVNGELHDQILEIEHCGIFRNKWVDEREIAVIQEYTCNMLNGIWYHKK
jgi:hypothetical protein